MSLMHITIILLNCCDFMTKFNKLTYKSIAYSIPCSIPTLVINVWGIISISLVHGRQVLYQVLFSESISIGIASCIPRL